jgi:hypothetical protein
MERMDSIVKNSGKTDSLYRDNSFLIGRSDLKRIRWSAACSQGHRIRGANVRRSFCIAEHPVHKVP